MNTEEDKKGAEKIESDLIAKIAISREADRAVNELTARVNKGFNAGKATKMQVTSHVITRFFNACTDVDIHAMRAQFFDAILVMEATLKQAKETGVIPESMRELLFQQFISSQGNAAPANKLKRALQSDSIKDNVSEDQEAA